MSHVIYLCVEDIRESFFSAINNSPSDKASKQQLWCDYITKRLFILLQIQYPSVALSEERCRIKSQMNTAPLGITPESHKTPVTHRIKKGEKKNMSAFNVDLWRAQIIMLTCEELS